MIIFIESILTPYLIARFNAINTVFNGNIEVWFQSASDVNRHWKEFPEIQFQYKVLKDRPLRIMGSDVLTFHINTDVISLLSANKTKIERIVCCGWDSFTLIYAAFWCQQQHIPYTIWAGSTENEKSLQRSVTAPLVCWIVRHADSCIAYGVRSQKYLEKLGAQKKQIDIFLNSVDVAYFHQHTQMTNEKRIELRQANNISEKDLVFLFVGQLIERKGILQLINAFLAVLESQQKPHISLMIIGDGPLEKEVVNLIPPIYRKHIRLIDHMEYSQLPQFYAISDVSILPSLREVWGLVVNEAMACGLPVLVSSRAGCADELVSSDQNGYTFESSAQDIQHAIQKMINKTSEQRTEMGKESYRIIRSYTDKKSAQKLLQRWKKI